MLTRVQFLTVLVLVTGLGAPLLVAGEPELHLKVDLALPDYNTGEPIPGTWKSGWTPFAGQGWGDMYSHDVRYIYDVNGTGINVGLSMAREGNGGLKCFNMCMYSKTGEGPPHGDPWGDPIANTWYYNVDWGGNPRGNIVLSLFCLPAGEYVLKSYHNFWIFCSAATRACTTCTPDMPPMPRIWAIGLIDAENVHPHNDSWNKLKGAAESAGCLGNHGGVELLKDATDVDYTTAYFDDQVATSEISFRTDGSAVLVIYEAPEGWIDPRGRLGGRGILNAFELTKVLPSDINTDGVADFHDFSSLALNWMNEDCGTSDWCDYTDLNMDGCVDIEDTRIFVMRWLEED